MASFDLDSKVLTTSSYIAGISDVRKLVAKILEVTETFEAKGFTVAVNTGTTNDEIWDGTITEVVLVAKKKLDDEVVNNWLDQVRYNLSLKQAAEIQAYRDQFHKNREATETKLVEKITTLKAAYNHVLQLKNNDVDDVGVIGAAKGVVKAERMLKEYQDKVAAELANPKPDSEIIEDSYYLKLENFMTNSDQVKLLGY